MAELRSCLQDLALVITITAAMAHFSVASTPISTTTNTSISENVFEGVTRRGDHDKGSKGSGCSKDSIKLAKEASVEAIKLGIAYANGTLSSMKELKKSGKISCKKCLNDCVRFYIHALAHLHEAIEYLGNKQYRMVKLEVVAAATDAYDCEDEFDAKTKKSPFTSRYKFFNDLCAIPIDLAYVLDPTISR
ncbi:hypothetical protein Sjap_025283 [Stephania japonica]|uniref:Pectinesterase inhibitor domain-containing protein n=1 Tax=Stephania japonica TaxID=461633 RepID=A0AAP0E5V7_9MAGN